MSSEYTLYTKNTSKLVENENSSDKEFLDISSVDSSSEELYDNISKEKQDEVSSDDETLSDNETLLNNTEYNKKKSVHWNKSVNSNKSNVSFLQQRQCDIFHESPLSVLKKEVFELKREVSTITTEKNIYKYSLMGLGCYALCSYMWKIVFR